MVVKLFSIGQDFCNFNVTHLNSLLWMDIFGDGIFVWYRILGFAVIFHWLRVSGPFYHLILESLLTLWDLRQSLVNLY